MSKIFHKNEQFFIESRFDRETRTETTISARLMEDASQRNRGTTMNLKTGIEDSKEFSI